MDDDGVGGFLCFDDTHKVGVCDKLRFALLFTKIPVPNGRAYI